MPRKKSTMLYRPFLRDAWRVTWERKSLWIFGFLAALISTGGVLDVVWKSIEQIDRTESLLKNLTDSSFVGYDVFADYLAHMTLLGPERVSWIISIATLLLLFTIVVATLSQGALLEGIRAKSHSSIRTLFTKASAHFWSLLTVALLNKILMVLLIVLVTLPLWFTSLTNASTHAVTFFLLMLVFVPLVILINIVYMFAIIHIVQDNAHPIDAIHTGIRLLSRQWLACFEYGLILFFVVFGAGVIALMGMLLLLIPYAFLFSSAVVSGSFALFLVLNILGGLTLLTGVVFLVSIAVTYQYSAWFQFYAHGLHKTHGNKIFSKIVRLLRR